MDLSTFALGLAYVGSAVGIAVVIPQVLRTVANPTMRGVSPWTWALAAISCSLWLTYGLRTASMPQVPGNAVTIVGAIAIVVLVPAGWHRRTRAAALLGSMTALLALSTTLEPRQVGFLAFGVGQLAAWPQVYETCWTRRGMGPSAISLASQAFGIAAQSCWLAFALITTDVPVIIGASLALVTFGLVTGVELSRRRAAARVDVPARWELQAAA